VARCAVVNGSRFGAQAVRQSPVIVKTNTDNKPKDSLRGIPTEQSPPQEARSADSHVREFWVCDSRGHGCPRSKQQFMESLIA